MNKVFLSLIFSTLVSTPLMALELPVDPSGMDTASLQRIMGATGVYDKQEKTFRISMPRDDLNILVNGIHLTAAMGLTSWITFKEVDSENVEMKGNLVLTEDQINPVMQTAIENHLDVTELHNHLMWESPKVMFMHIEAMGDPKILATEMNTVFAKVKETANGVGGDFPIGEIDTSNTTISQSHLESILGARGALKDGVYKISIDKKSAAASADEEEAANVTHSNISATFAGSDEAAVLDGDFAMQEPNLQKVLQALNKAGISIVAIHERMIGDKARVVFLHYWAVGKPGDLARGLRNALNVSQQPVGLNMVAKNQILNDLRAVRQVKVSQQQLGIVADNQSPTSLKTTKRPWLRPIRADTSLSY
jgi:hypothetical protein